MSYAQLEVDELLAASELGDEDQAELDDVETELDDDTESFDDLDTEMEDEGMHEADAQSEWGGDLEVDALAYELMTLNDEAEADEFLGKVFRSAAKGLRRVAKRALPKVMPLLRGPAGSLLKRAMPLIGSAAGSIVPGAGTLVGGFAGQKLGQLLGGNMEYASDDEARLELSRKLVSTVADAVNHAAEDPASVAQPAQAARTALIGAMQTNLPAGVRRALAGAGKPSSRGGSAGGRWVRRGNQIILFGA